MISKYMKEFLIQNKDIINKQEWDVLFENAQELSLEQEDMDTLVWMIKKICPIDPKIVFKNYSHYLVDDDNDDIHRKFYRIFNVEDIPFLKDVSMNDLYDVISNMGGFDFSDDIDFNKRVGGSNLYIVTTDASHIEFRLDAFSDKDHKNFIGCFYIYDADLNLNMLVLDGIGIGYNENAIKNIRDYNLLNKLKKKLEILE